MAEFPVPNALTVFRRFHSEIFCQAVTRIKPKANCLMKKVMKGLCLAYGIVHLIAAAHYSHVIDIIIELFTY